MEMTRISLLVAFSAFLAFSEILTSNANLSCDRGYFFNASLYNESDPGTWKSACTLCPVGTFNELPIKSIDVLTDIGVDRCANRTTVKGKKCVGDSLCGANGKTYHWCWTFKGKEESEDEWDYCCASDTCHLNKTVGGDEKGCWVDESLTQWQPCEKEGKKKKMQLGWLFGVFVPVGVMMFCVVPYAVKRKQAQKTNNCPFKRAEKDSKF